MVRQLMKLDIRRAMIFGEVFQFIDDLTMINDGGELKETIKRFSLLKLS